MGCQPYWDQISNISSAIRSLQRAGISEAFPGLKEMRKLRAGLLARVTVKFPRIALPLKLPIVLSPTRITPMFDLEAGWFVEQRVAPGATPTYRKITEEEAIALLQETPPRDLVERLAVTIEPPDY